MKSASDRGFFRSLLSSRHHASPPVTNSSSSSNQHDDDDEPRRGSGSTSSSTGTSFSTMRSAVKHHSFSGHLSFQKLAQGSSNGFDPAANGERQSSILSKRPSLIIPFSTHHQPSTDAHGEAYNYLEDFQAPIAKSGVLIKQANHLKTWKKRLMVLKGHSLFYYVSGTSGEDTYPRGVIPLIGVRITPVDATRFKKQNCFEICHPAYRPIFLMAKSDADLNVWMSSLTSAAMATTVDRTMLLVKGDDLEKLFDTPALEDALPYKRAYYFRQKVAFCLPRPSLDRRRAPSDLFELNEKRLTTLLDLNSYCDAFPLILCDPQLFVELLHLIGAYIFRPFTVPQNTAPPNIFVDDSAGEDGGSSSLNGSGETGNPMDKYSDYTPEEQAWGMLSACYDLLLKAIEHIDKLEKHLRKEFFTLRFVAQLVNLFKSPSFKERQLLKGVLHRLYYKLTQRRSAIRKEIAHVFYEYIYETSNHHGVAELLEILGSIVNGFACPIKDEHITLLERALIPLHSTPAFISYHQQLAYCMIQYVSKDHSLFTPIVRGLLKYWPVGNSFKEVVFVVEFEELLEHVLAESDFHGISRQLARRLGKCMVSAQFQVAERAISCWHSASCVRIMNEYEKVAQGMFDVIKPYLRQAMTAHWNPIIQQKAHETYMVYYNMGYEHDEAFIPVLNGTAGAVGAVGALPMADASSPVSMVEGSSGMTTTELTMPIGDEVDVSMPMTPGSPTNQMTIRLSSDMIVAALGGDEDDEEEEDEFHNAMDH